MPYAAGSSRGRKTGETGATKYSPFGFPRLTSLSGMAVIPRVEAKRRFVMPAQAGIHLRARCNTKEILDSGLRRNDDSEELTFSRRIQEPCALSRGSFSLPHRGFSTAQIRRSSNKISAALLKIAVMREIFKANQFSEASWVIHNPVFWRRARS